MRKPPLGGSTSPNRRRYARYRPPMGCTTSGLRGLLRRGLVGPGGRPVGRTVGWGPGSGPGGQWRDRHRDGPPARPPADRSERRPKPLQCRGKRTPGLRLGASGAAHRHPRGKPLRLRVADGRPMRGPVRRGQGRVLGPAAGDHPAFGAGCDGATRGHESDICGRRPRGETSANSLGGPLTVARHRWGMHYVKRFAACKRPLFAFCLYSKPEAATGTRRASGARPHGRGLKQSGLHRSPRQASAAVGGCSATRPSTWTTTRCSTQRPFSPFFCNGLTEQ